MKTKYLAIDFSKGNYRSVASHWEW